MATEKVVQQAIYYVLQENAFVGNLLQEITIRISEEVPTAALRYDKNDSRFEVVLNEEFFKKIELEERKGVFFHELLHFTHGHIFRFEQIGTPKEHTIKNIAADMSINQYIKALPKGCVDVADWKQKDGTPFPLYQPMETYFDLLKQTTNPPQDPDEGDQDGEGEGQEGKGKGKGKGKGQGQGGESINYDKYKKYSQFDEHEWDDLTDDEKQRMLQEAKKVVTRAVDKAYKDYSTMPDAVKELMQKIDADIKKLNYKAILKHAIKKTLSTPDRAHTWHRPSKRFGVYAPGTTNDKAPYVFNAIDTSGSISHREFNEFKMVMDGLLKAASKRCLMGMWHTDLYSVKKYKLNQEINMNEIQSGGTDVGPVLEYIEKNKPNLSVILTDGYFGKSKINLTQKIVWVISKNGTVDHPYKDYGITIKLDGLVEK